MILDITVGVVVAIIAVGGSYAYQKKSRSEEIPLLKDSHKKSIFSVLQKSLEKLKGIEKVKNSASSGLQNLGTSKKELRVEELKQELKQEIEEEFREEISSTKEREPKNTVSEAVETTKTHNEDKEPKPSPKEKNQEEGEEQRMSEELLSTENESLNKDESLDEEHRPPDRKHEPLVEEHKPLGEPGAGFLDEQLTESLDEESESEDQEELGYDSVGIDFGIEEEELEEASESAEGIEGSGSNEESGSRDENWIEELSKDIEKGREDKIDLQRDLKDSEFSVEELEKELEKSSEELKRFAK